MKKFCPFLLIFLFLSCQEDFFTENPKGVVTIDVLLSSTEVQSAVDGLAQNFSGIFSQAGCVAPFMGGDDLNACAACCKRAFREIDIFDATSDNDRLDLWWRNCYSTIRLANAIIDNAEKIEAAEPIKNDVLGHAHFYRGLSYSFLTRIYGKVPLIVSFQFKTNQPVQAAEVNNIYMQIISDLQKAEELLPEVRPEQQDEWGGYPGAKPCKGTVKALLSQVYLTMAGWPLKLTSYYELAALKAREVIDSAEMYGYELLSDPHDLWTWENNYTNKEIILGYYFNLQMGSGNMHAPLAARPREYTIPNIAWASGWADYTAEISFFNRFPEGSRKDATYQTIIDVPNVGEVPWHDRRTYLEHPYFKKYQEAEPEATWAGSRTAQIIRYAEVLLNYAEARAMASGPDQSAYNAVNAIRHRAGLPDLTPGLSAIAFRDSVVAERGWEFAGGEPASRWFDLIRLEKLEEFTALRDSSEMDLTHFPTHDDYWLPLPAELAESLHLINQEKN